MIYFRPGNRIDFINLNKVINRSHKKPKAFDPCLEKNLLQEIKIMNKISKLINDDSGNILGDHSF